MAFKMKGFNPGNGTGMGSAFNKATDPPPKTKMDSAIINRTPGNFDLSEVNYSVNQAKWDQNKKKNQEWKDSDKRKELLPKEPTDTIEIPKDQQVVQLRSPVLEWLGGGIGKTVKGVQSLNKGKGIIHNIKNFKLPKWGTSTKSTKSTKVPDYKKHQPKTDYVDHGEILGRGGYYNKANKWIPNPKVEDILNKSVRPIGKQWDEAYKAKPWKWEKSMFREMPITGKSGKFNVGMHDKHKLVNVKPPGLPDQNFILSSGGGKKFKFHDGKKISSKGTYYPWVGHANKGNWTVKGGGVEQGMKQGWDKGYGSQLMTDMSEIIKNFHKSK